MKQLLFPLLICLSLTASAQAKRQHRTDSLRVALTTAKDDTEQVAILLKLGRRSMDADKDKTIMYAQQALALAEKLDDKKDMATASNQLGIAYADENKYFKAIKNYVRELELSRALKDKQREGGTLCNIGNLYAKLVYLNKAMDNYMQAKELLEEIGYKPFLAKTISGMAWVYVQKEDYTVAISYYKQALETYTALADKRNMADICNELAWLHYQKMQYKDAEADAMQAMAFARDAAYTAALNRGSGMLDKIHIQEKKKAF